MTATKTRDAQGQPGRRGTAGTAGLPRSTEAPRAGSDSRPAPPPADGAAHDVEALLERLRRRLDLEASAPAVEPPPGYRPDAKGRLVPEKLIRPADELEDATVRRVLAFGVDLADQVARFRRHSWADVGAFLDVIAGEYGLPRKPGRRGNFTLQSYDGLLKVVIQVQDRIVFGPELQIARGIVDECIAEWSNGQRAEVVALLQAVFEPDREGQIPREAVFRLRRIEIDDARWKQVRQAIDNAVRVVGTKAYLRLYLRGSTDAPWRAVPIDIASDWADTDELAEATE